MNWDSTGFRVCKCHVVRGDYNGILGWVAYHTIHTSQCTQPMYNSKGCRSSDKCKARECDKVRIPIWPEGLGKYAQMFISAKYVTGMLPRHLLVP
jgi:hypothetical protein